MSGLDQDRDERQGRDPSDGAAARGYARLLGLVPDHAGDDGWREDAVETFADLDRAVGIRGRWPQLVQRLRFFSGALVLVLRVAITRAGARSGERSRGSVWQQLRDDTRLARRSLVRRPGFSVAVVVILALAIGAATAVFSVVDGVLLRPLPYPHADRLLFFDEGSHPGPLFERWQRELTSFDGLAAARDQSLDLVGQGPPLSVAAVDVSADFFTLFGARPLTGRLFDEGDRRPGTRVVVLGAELWQRRWGGDPSVVGQTVSLEGEPWTVVGVVHSDFVSPELVAGRRVDVWRPLDLDAEAMRQWDHWALSVVGRLAESASVEVAQQELDTIARSAAEAQPDQRTDREGAPLMTPLVPLQRATVARVENALLMLLGAVGLMLLVGYANVAGLFLAWGTERRREMSLRLALGARRRRLAAQLLCESIALSLAGGVAGVVVAQLLTRGFRSLVPANLPRFDEVAVDGRVLAVALGAALLTGVVFGLAPAFQAARARAGRALRPSATVSSRRTHRARGALVVAEVALALVLLSGAGLLGHSLLRALRTELGFQPEGLVRLAVRLGDGYDEDRRLQFTRDLLARVEAMPGVRSAALGWTVPLDFTGGSRCCWRSGFRRTAEEEPTPSMVHPVSPAYFHTLGARVLAGRELVWHDSDVSPVPAVVNRTLAEALFPGGALDRTLIKGKDTLRIVGVVDDVKRWGARADRDHAVYLPYDRFGTEMEELKVVMRTESALTEGFAEVLRQQVWEIDPSLPVGEVVTLEQQVARSVAGPRFYAVLLGGFAALALILAAVGLCGTLLYLVSQRRREMGIRLAVGAGRTDLLRLVLGQGMVLVGIGLALGLAGSLAMSRVLRSMVYGISATDPATYGVVCLLLVASAWLAAYLPARRAAATDPIETLRSE